MKPTFNKPILYTSLLSEQFHNVDSKHPVYSMVVLDEFTLRTPDALMSGLATEQVIQNTCPSISNAGELYISDIQHLLATLKIASYGSKMDFRLRCPKCNADDPYELDLQTTVPYMTCKKWFGSLDLDGLSIQFHPPTYRQFTEFSIQEFKINKQLFTISKMDHPDDHAVIISTLLDQKRKLQCAYHSSCIASITIHPQNQLVIDKKFVNEWFSQADVEVQERIKNYIVTAVRECVLPEMKLKCDECKNEMNIPIDLDFSVQFRNKLISASDAQVLDIINQMGNETKTITQDLLRMIWHMRGSISYSEAFNLTTHERSCIAKIIEDNIEISRQIKMPYV